MWQAPTQPPAAFPRSGLRPCLENTDPQAMPGSLAMLEMTLRQPCTVQPKAMRVLGLSAASTTLQFDLSSRVNTTADVFTAHTSVLCTLHKLLLLHPGDPIVPSSPRQHMTLRVPGSVMCPDNVEGWVRTSLELPLTCLLTRQTILSEMDADAARELAVSGRDVSLDAERKMVHRVVVL